MESRQVSASVRLLSGGKIVAETAHDALDKRAQKIVCQRTHARFQSVVILGKYASVISGDEVGPLTAIGVFHQPQAQGAQTRKPAVGIDRTAVETRIVFQLHDSQV